MRYAKMRNKKREMRNKNVNVNVQFRLKLDRQSYKLTENIFF